MSLSRHHRRILLIQAIFLWEETLSRKPELKKSKESQEKALHYIWSHFNASVKESIDHFVRERFFGICDTLDELRSLLTRHAPDWPLQKIASHDRAVLYLGIFELLHTDLPGAVVINESVELSKEFGGDRSSKFINGVLSTLYKEHVCTKDSSKK